MNKQEEAAYACLANGSVLVNPVFSSKPAATEAALKIRCKACWHLRENFPYWTKALVEKWTKERAGANENLSG